MAEPSPIPIFEITQVLAMHAALFLTFFVAVLYVVQRLLDYLWAIRSTGFVLRLLASGGYSCWPEGLNVSNHPGYRTLLSQSGILGNFLLPPIPGISPGRNHLFRHKYQSELWALLNEKLPLNDSSLSILRLGHAFRGRSDILSSKCGC